MKKLLTTTIAAFMFTAGATVAADLEVLQEALGNYDVTATVDADDLLQLGTADDLSNVAINAANLASISDASVGAIALAGPTVNVGQIATAPSKITEAAIDIDDTIEQSGALSSISNLAIGALNSLEIGN